MLIKLLYLELNQKLSDKTNLINYTSHQDLREEFKLISSTYFSSLEPPSISYQHPHSLTQFYISSCSPKEAKFGKLLTLSLSLSWLICSNNNSSIYVSILVEFNMQRSNLPLTNRSYHKEVSQHLDPSLCLKFVLLLSTLITRNSVWSCMHENQVGYGLFLNIKNGSKVEFQVQHFSKSVHSDSWDCWEDLQLCREPRSKD